MKILITGSNGYLGRNLTNSLSNYQLGFFNRGTSIEYIKEFAPDVVIHTICSYGRKGETIEQVYESNFIAGLKILECLKGTKSTFINCGTSLNKFTNPYSISKGQFVELGNYLSDDNLQFVNMNLQHFYGPNASNNFITYMFEQCLKNNKVSLTEGIQKRDFIYIDDVINAFISVINNRSSLKEFENIDVGTGNTTQLKTVIEIIHELCNSKSILGFGEIPMRNSEELEMKADTTLLRQLGWTPSFNINQGLRLIRDFYSER